MRLFVFLLRDSRGNSAVEMALITPFLLALMFGAAELGNYFMTEHALEKSVRDGARFASRLALDPDYACPGAVFADPDAENNIVKVTKDGAVDGDNNPRWDTYWTRTCTGKAQTVSVTIRCVPKGDIDQDDTGNTGIYTSLDGEIPVVKVSGAVHYASVLGSLGFDATNICLQAESEAAVTGL